MNFHEADESHYSSIPVENRYRPPYMREDGTSTNVNGEHSILIRTMTLQRLFANINPTI